MPLLIDSNMLECEGPKHFEKVVADGDGTLDPQSKHYNHNSTLKLLHRLIDGTELEMLMCRERHHCVH